jgi:hypothetical protein
MYEKMRGKVADIARKKLHKMDAADDELAEAVLIEKRKLKLAKKAPWYTLHLAYIVAFVWVAFCGYFNLLFSLSLGVHVTQEYLTSAATAIISQILISEPASIFVRTLVLPWVLGALAGTNVAGVAEAAIDIGLGAVTGAGAVSFADRLMAQRRESAAIKAQTALRRIRDRRIYLKMRKEQEDAKRHEQELHAQNTLSKAASGVVDTMMDDDGMPVMDEVSVRKAIARKGIKIKKKKRVARGQGVTSVGSKRTTLLRGSGEKDADNTSFGPSTISTGSDAVVSSIRKGPPRRKTRKPMRKQMTTMESMQGPPISSLSGPAMPLDDAFGSSMNAITSLVGPRSGDSNSNKGDSAQQLTKMLKKKKKLVRGQGERR